MCRKIVKKIFSLVFKIVFSRKKLDFVIIGAQKSGTTALFNYLNMHPFCVGAPGKETLFFSHYYREKRNKICHYFFSGRNIKKEVAACKIHPERTLWFEATPENVYLEEIPKRIYRHNPDARLIFLVREPVSRAISEYNMACMYAREKGLCVREDSEQEYFACLKDPDKYPFTWFVEEELRKIRLHDSYLPSAFNYPDFIRHGLYSEQLERYYIYFKPEQILIIEDKQLKNQLLETLFSVEEFLNIPHIDWRDKKAVNSNIGVYSLPVPEDCKQFLYHFFEPWNEKFFEKTGRRFEWPK